MTNLSSRYESSKVTQRTPVTGIEGAACDGNTYVKAKITEVTPGPSRLEGMILSRELKQPEIRRPCFITHDEPFILHGQKAEPGLYWHAWNKPKGGSDPEPVDIWISLPIHAVAHSQDQQGSNNGLLLRFLDSRGRWKEWAAPMRLLAGNGDELRRELLDNGLRISPKGRHLLLDWLMSQNPERQLTAASCTGWTPDMSSFVLPSRTVGQEGVLFQSDQPAHDLYTPRGTLEDWRQTVAMPCRGNPILTLVLSVAFAGPLLLRAKQQHSGGAGIHLMGDSSKGKTTALQVSASVWGPPEFVGSWKATGNGLEATAAARNDTLLPLDEISESNSKEIGSIVYALGNGQGKQRAARSGGARRSARWRLFTLSSGERSLSAHMSESGQDIKAGQEARLLDIPATNRTFGAFDDLHGLPDGSAFANALKQATSQHYGVAGPAFIEHLIDDASDLYQLYADFCNIAGLQGTHGIEPRAAGIFALIAMAGEKATEYGLTGWEEGEAIKAAIEAFSEWRAFRGKGSTESDQILNGVRAFLEKHGDSRFSELHAVSEDYKNKIRDRAGYWKDDPQGRVYLFNSPALKEAGKGFDLSRVLGALDDAGWIAARSPGRNSKSYKIAGNVSWLYTIRPLEIE